jgi:glycerate-2-kinase
MKENSYTSHEQLDGIIQAALNRADSADIITQCVHLSGSMLQVNTESTELAFDLDGYDRLIVLGVGKAAARMARALEEVLGSRLHAGVIVTKYGHGEPLDRIELFEAGHPVPDEGGVRAARRMEELLADADERTMVVSLVSGGGSALLVDPYHDEDRRISLDEMQEVTRLLLSCGADIGEINCVRKHLSNVKGGRLARMMAPATSLNLILSDVVGDDPPSIASGITAPDPTSYVQARAIAQRYGVLENLPAGAREIIEAGARGEIPETPNSSDEIFERVHNVVIGSNTQALLAAADQARTAGYRTFVLTSRLVGEAREVAKLFPGIARDVLEKDMLSEPPLCVLTGGETTVTIKDQSGKGGRNQELVLSALRQWALAPEKLSGACFASVATDGNDGPTDAAGAFIDERIAGAAAEDMGRLDHALEHNDAYHYLNGIGALLRTGPTNTNVCDIQILIVEPPR